MRECPTCGMEFCAKCHSGSAFCPECSDETNLDLDPEDEEDPELSAVSDLLEDVDEVDEEDPDAETDTERA